MEWFNIIAGSASILSFLISIFLALKIVKISTRISTNNSRSIDQKVRGDGNTVSAGDVNNG